MRSLVLSLLIVALLLGIPLVCRSQEVAPTPFSIWPTPKVHLISGSSEPDECSPGNGGCQPLPQGLTAAGSRGFVQDFLLEETSLILQDFEHTYSTRGLCCLGLSVAIAAPLANTSRDRRFQNWYQRQARSSTADEFADITYFFGQHWCVLPVLLTATIGGKCAPDSEMGQNAYTWGDRTIRAMIVGAPAIGLLQWGLGGDRPREGNSHWRPFRTNKSVSGHAFIGALPFMAGATMTENRPLQALLMAGSCVTAWSRVHKDGHFVSQSIIGWSIAAIAMHSVWQTDFANGRVLIVPTEIADTTGVGVLIRY